MELDIYLIGQITKNPITYEWRATVRERVNKLPERVKRKIRIIDPCNNHFSKRMLREANGNSVDFSTNVVRNQQSKLFPAIDKQYVKVYSNACIFNANHFSPETPFLGTIYELAWYHDHPEKPVVGIFEGNTEEDYLCKHPFVQDTVHAWVKDERQALDLLISLLHD